MISIGICKFLSDDTIMYFRWEAIEHHEDVYSCGFIYPKLYTTFEDACCGDEDYMYNFNTCTHNLEDVMICLNCFDTSWTVCGKCKACRCPECMMLSNTSL